MPQMPGIWRMALRASLAPRGPPGFMAWSRANVSFYLQKDKGGEPLNCLTRSHSDNLRTTEPLIHHEQQRPQPQEPAPARQAVSALFRFQFQRRYGGLYSNKNASFVLREEHLLELKRLVNEHNREGCGRAGPLSISDIVNAALDFALEHSVAFQYEVAPDNLRETLAREVYRKAFLHFLRHEVL